MQKIKKIPIYLFLIAVYPVLTLMAFNIHETTLASGLRTFLLSIILSLVFLLIFWFILRDWDKAALLTSWTLILFFSYGHLYDAIRQIAGIGGILGRHRFLLPVWAILFFIGYCVIKRKLADPQKLIGPLSAATLILIIWPVFQILSFSVTDYINRVQLSNTDASTFGDFAPEELPDVYYIILDAYARDDTLLEFFDYDNGEFLEELASRDFYVALCSQSNYPKTRLSLTSTLNRDYVDKILVIDGSTSKEEISYQYIQQNQVRKDFKSLGYTIVAFETEFFWTEWTDADLYLSKYSTSQGGNSKLQQVRQLNNFEAMFIETTLVKAGLDLETIILQDFARTVKGVSTYGRYRTVTFAIESLPGLAEIPEPTFVFAHIVTPHQPYVIDATGKYIESGGNYIDQLIHINYRILEVVDQILLTSESEPIIIIQGDHGATGTNKYPERLNILNAYRLPDNGNELLYPSISPVNTFRLIFDKYFGTDFGLLEDINYLSTKIHNTEADIFPDTREGCE
jgi:hypothetical protein